MLVEGNWWRPFADGGDVVETLWRQGGGGGGGEVDLVGGPQGDLLSVGFSLFRRAELNIITIAHTSSFSVY